MKKKIIWWFSSSWNEKKNDVKKKKKKEAETGMGYCPFSVCFGSRYSRLYRDTTRLGRHGCVAKGHDTAMTRPRHGRACTTIRLACARHGLGCDTIMYRDWGQKAASLRHGAPALACAQRHDRGLLRHDQEGATTRSRVRQDTA